MWYDIAQEAKPIAEDLVRQHHTHLATAKIGYLFREKASKKGGKIVWGTASKFPPKYQAFFARAEKPEGAVPDGATKEDEEYQFLIELAWDVWQTLDNAKKVALLDHELSHCWGEEEEGEKDGKSGGMTWSIVSHDFEEFGDVIRRNGLYHEALVDAKRVFAAAV